MRRLTVPALLGVAHGGADAAAGLLLGSVLYTRVPQQAGALVLLYNALAFGGQPVAGLLVDRFRRPRTAAVGGLLLLCIALIISGRQQSFAVAMAACGSALFHVGGGALSVCATRDRAIGPGLFAAPGVIGLAIGGALAWTNHFVIWPFVLMLLGSTVTIITMRSSESFDTDSRDEPLLDEFEVALLLLLAAIAFRSALWSGLQFVFQDRINAVVSLALAACVGKTLGGILADRIGWRRWTTGALLGATPFLVFGEQHILALLVGVALLQSATPVALAATARLLPRRPATAAGLALGLGIAVGGVPAYSGLTSMMTAPPVIALLIAAAGLAFWRVLGSERTTLHLQR